MTAADVDSRSGRGVEERPALDVRDLSIEFETHRGRVPVVDDVSFSVRHGRTLAIVGESGSGKSVSCMAIMGLLPRRSSHIGGSVRLQDEELLGRPERELQELRGSRIAMIFQEPMTSLNPAYTIGNQISEVVRRHSTCGRADAKLRAIEALALVGIPQPERRLNSYPHEFSGGMRQRAMIAAALACEPSVLIADEPTTALDVTVQAQILDLIRALTAELDLATIWVTHDMGVVADLADDVVVMYAGQVVEHQPVHDLFATPTHPYTNGLLRSMPNMQRRHEALTTIGGAPPTPGSFSRGCRFAPRCPHVAEQCVEPVELTPLANGSVRCVRHEELQLGVIA